MIVCDSGKFVFAHVPKTAGTSIWMALEPFADGTAAAHANTAHESLRDFIARHPEKRGHFTFAFVRNPWERAVSFYFHARQRLAPTLPQMQAVDSVEGMLRLLDKGVDWVRDLLSLKPQCDFLRDGDGVLLTDFTGRYERLADDFAHVCHRTGIDVALPKKNVSSHDPYARYYSDWGKGFVAAYYREDITQFGYRFEAVS